MNMYVVSVEIHVKPEDVEAFVDATADNHLNTRKEPGNLRFDVSRRLDDPNRFFLYEVYRDEAAFKAHQQTAHYFRWREAVADSMAEPRVGRKHMSLHPADDGAEW
jgi:(4S)-4-hydroxy-5-phosphonooxypentane-2,3-dione isomerase